MYSYENAVMRPVIANNLYMPKEELPHQEKELRNVFMNFPPICQILSCCMFGGGYKTRINLFPHQCSLWGITSSQTNALKCFCDG